MQATWGGSHGSPRKPQGLPTHQYIRDPVLLPCPARCHHSQVLGAVPPARLATAMLSSAAGSASPSVALSAAAAARDAADEALVSRLEWLRGWTEQVAEKDPDDSCRQGDGSSLV